MSAKGKTDDLSAKTRDEAVKHAWQFFDFHAKQRIDMLRLFIGIQAVTIAGYGLASKENLIFFGIILSFLSMTMCAFFYLIDRRTVHLIKISESALEKEQIYMANDIKSNHIRILRKAHIMNIITKRIVGFRISYSSIIKYFFIVNSLISVIALFYFVIQGVSGAVESRFKSGA